LARPVEELRVTVLSSRAGAANQQSFIPLRLRDRRIRVFEARHVVREQILVHNESRRICNAPVHDDIRTRCALSGNLRPCGLQIGETGRGAKGNNLVGVKEGVAGFVSIELLPSARRDPYLTDIGCKKAGQSTVVFKAVSHAVLMPG
jgi:hypothetical protein